MVNDRVAFPHRPTLHPMPAPVNPSWLEGAVDLVVGPWSKRLPLLMGNFHALSVEHEMTGLFQRPKVHHYRFCHLCLLRLPQITTFAFRATLARKTLRRLGPHRGGFLQSWCMEVIPMTVTPASTPGAWRRRDQHFSQLGVFPLLPPTTFAPEGAEVVPHHHRDFVPMSAETAGVHSVPDSASCEAHFGSRILWTSDTHPTRSSQSLIRSVFLPIMTPAVRRRESAFRNPPVIAYPVASASSSSSRPSSSDSKSVERIFRSH